jgi:hypothetical protein
MSYSTNPASCHVRKGLLFMSLPVLVIFGTAATAETLSARSGKSAEIVAEARVDSGGTLRGLMILEKSDRPCVVQLYGTSGVIDKYEGRIERCNGGGPKQAKGIDSTKGQVFIKGGGSYVTGLKVCLSSSDRVKGWTLYGKSNNSPNTVSDSFKRNNCPDNGWQNRVDCPAGTKAIGVQAYFEPGSGTRSASLRGMKLICN